MSKEFEMEIARLAKRIEQTKELTLTEESTKMSFVLPFFRALGYDYTDPREIMAEFTADINSKNMDKVDYVIMDQGQPAILVECKHWGEKLDSHINQLFKYFVSTPAKFAILTNGIEYLFYTDLEEQNKLDKKPFLKVNLLDLKAHALKELAKFRKDTFDVGEILTTAEELKYTNSILNLLAEEYQTPSDDFVKYVLSKVYDGVRTQAAIEKFRSTVKNSFMQFVNELINERLETAFRSEVGKTPVDTQEMSAVVEITEPENAGVVATEEEMETYYMIKGILAEAVSASRISYKSTSGYFSITFDNKPTKWICRLVFKQSSKTIIFPNDIHNDKIPLDHIDEIYKHKELLLQSVKRFIT